MRLFVHGSHEDDKSFIAHPVDDVVAAAAAACRALAITDGPTYTQVLLSPDGPRVMEVAARLGGGHDAELCAAALGVDLSVAAVRAALGRPPGPLEAVRDRAAVVRFLIAPPGRLRRVEGLRRPLIIAISGYGLEEDRQRSRDAGIDHHLTKPVDIRTIAGLIEQPR